MWGAWCSCTICTMVNPALPIRTYTTTNFSELHIYIYIYIYGVRSSGHPTGQKVKPNTADMEALSYVGFSPPAQFLL